MTFLGKYLGRTEVVVRTQIIMITINNLIITTEEDSFTDFSQLGKELNHALRIGRTKYVRISPYLLRLQISCK